MEWAILGALSAHGLGAATLIDPEGIGDAGGAVRGEDVSFLLLSCFASTTTFHAPLSMGWLSVQMGALTGGLLFFLISLSRPLNSIWCGCRGREVASRRQRDETTNVMLLYTVTVLKRLRA